MGSEEVVISSLIFLCHFDSSLGGFHFRHFLQQEPHANGVEQHGNVEDDLHGVAGGVNCMGHHFGEDGHGFGAH